MADTKFIARSPRCFKVPKRPADCWDWLTPEDVCRHALAAFYMACESIKPPMGTSFVQLDGDAWAMRESFADNLLDVFALRVQTEGYHLGVNPEWEKEARRLQLWKMPRAVPGVWGEPPCERSAAGPESSGQLPVSDLVAGSAAQAASGASLRGLKSLFPKA